MNARRLSLTLRLTLLFAGVSTAILLLLGWMIGQAVEQHFIEQDMETLTGKIHLAHHLLEQSALPNAEDKLHQQLEDALVGHHDLAVQITLGNGQTLFSTPDAPFPPGSLPTTRRNGPLSLWQHGDHPWRGLVSRLDNDQPALQGVQIAVAVDISHHQHFMAAFRKTLWLFVSLAALLSALLGGLVVRHGLAPLHAIRQGAEGVTASRLDYRLQVDAMPAELNALATTLNAMLARLEDSFQRLKDFSSDLAHELRTPISNLMTETQVALSRARSPEAYRDVLASNAEEYERLARMIGDMLFLAQSDHGQLLLQREVVDLAEQVHQLFDFFDALAEEKNLHLSVSGQARLNGDKLMLRRALANLLSNAIRHTPPGGEIGFNLASTASGIQITLENTGEPIPAEHLPRLFDRFYRADPSRHHSGEGAGLGLAITRAILRAHGGEISVRSASDRVCFSIELPDQALPI